MICTSLEANLWAVYKGLTIILQRGFNQVILETDAEQVVYLLSEDLGERCPFWGIVEDARIIMRGVTAPSSILEGKPTFVLMQWLS